jgi:hypothetical protein
LSSASGADADGIKFAGTGHIIRGNYIHDLTWADTGNNAYPSDPDRNPHIDGMQSCCRQTGNILIEKNLISLKDPGGSYTQGIYVDDATFTNINCVNNIVEVIQPINYQNVTTGTIYNNTLIPGTPEQSSSNAIQVGSSSDIKVKNNLIYERVNDPWHFYLYIASSSGLDVGYNQYYRTGSTTNGPYTNDLDADAMFVDPGNILGADGLPFTADDGLVLQGDSPAIDSGADLSVDTDVLGNSRPLLNGYDRGAYEYRPHSIDLHRQP